jgi:hypothetical protein
MKNTRILALCGALLGLTAMVAGCSNDELNGEVDTSKLPTPLADGPTLSGAAAGAPAGGAAAKPAANNASMKPQQ